MSNVKTTTIFWSFKNKPKSPSPICISFPSKLHEKIHQNNDDFFCPPKLCRKEYIEMTWIFIKYIEMTWKFVDIFPSTYRRNITIESRWIRCGVSVGYITRYENIYLNNHKDLI